MSNTFIAYRGDLIRPHDIKNAKVEPVSGSPTQCVLSFNVGSSNRLYTLYGSCELLQTKLDIFNRFVTK